MTKRVASKSHEAVGRDVCEQCRSLGNRTERSGQDRHIVAEAVVTGTVTEQLGR
jgi:hypothetical protein